MWSKVETWQFRQLERLASADPDRAETILNTVWRSFPGLLGELAIGAVDQEELTVQACAELLDMSEEDVEQRLHAYRRRSQRFDYAVVHDRDTHIARLADGKIAVWEIIREFRKLGSVDRLRQAFPGVSEADLASAFRYAEAHAKEIEQLIEDYESRLAKMRAEYPFAK